MPDRRQHRRDGAVMGGLVGFFSALNKTQTPALADVLTQVLVGIGIGAAGARLPDVLEPANTPDHRGCFHSAEIAMALTPIALRTYRDSQWKQAMLVFGAPAVAGYLVHLLADARTPAGLPSFL